ncbi:DUF1801 domain-containing protein [Luteococcus sp. Sow4_B9]|uniref:DUF1801 domain-containing protein n=1 Tax=Luteococcus sp. Sow4_B9 TaxID=3438792 RepID=UPI003F9471A0
MHSKATTLDEFWASIPEKRLPAVQRLYDEISRNIDPGYELIMYCGMPTWVVPHSRYPQGYHCSPEDGVARFSLGNQGGHVAVYDMGMYADPDVLQWFVDEYAKTGWKPNMGKSCIRFTAMTKIPFELVGQLAAKIPMEEFITRYEANDPRTRR